MNYNLNNFVNSCITKLNLFLKQTIFFNNFQFLVQIFRFLRMAFQIHRDTTNNVINSKLENKKFIKNQNDLKETKIPTKRIPLHSNNNCRNNVQVEKKFACARKAESQIEIYQDPVPVKEPQEIETKNVKNFKILEEIPTFNNILNKENVETTVESQESFYFSVDQFYITTAEYHDNIYAYLLNMERSLKRPKIDYMSKQPELSFKMRSILIDWLSAVTEEYNMQPQTFQLAVQYIDCFLSRMSVVKNKFQLVGTAAMMIAAKYEEIYPPDTKEWSYLTADAFTPKQLLKMEQLILKVLQFDVAQPTAYSFISHICFVCNLSKKIMLLALYFSELVLLEGEDYIKYFPSQLAFAAVALARHTLNEKELWPKVLENKTGYSLKQLSPIIKRQHKSFKDSPTKVQQAIQEKFKTVKYGRVSLFTPKELDAMALEK